MSNKILLTGAGFSHNFGAPLASGMWSLIFNQISSSSKVKDRMRKNPDYESLYNEVIQEDGSQYSAQEKNEFITAVYKAYTQLDNIISLSLKYSQSGLEFSVQSSGELHLNLHDLVKFLNKFSSRRGGCGYLFTLNQDLLLEKLYHGIKFSENIDHSFMISTPPVDSPVYASHFQHKDQNDSGVIPNNEGLVEWRNKFECSMKDNRKDPIYIKLHGSYDWRYQDNQESKVMVLGAQKKKQIDSIPLLKWYFELFSSSLFVDNSKILIIGYGFNDQHINQLLVRAVCLHGLRIHIVNPCSFENFKKKSFDNPIKQQQFSKLLPVVDGYYEASLQDIFPLLYDDCNGSNLPSIVSRSVTWEQIRKNFFGGS